MRRVPFFDLRVTDLQDRKDLLKAFETVLDHGRIILGPEVEELEKKFSDYFHGHFAVGVSSGTDALFIGIRSLGIGMGDEVIVPALSWIATANAVRMTGATPVFCEVGSDLNLDISSVERVLNPKTKLILPVHYTGKMCDMEALRKLSQQTGVPLMEDASQAFGASQNGKKAGTWGKVSAVSLNSMKILNALGEAGVCLTEDLELKKRIEALRYNGCYNRETCMEPSLNGRIDTVQAAILLVRLQKVEQGIERRRVVAKRYSAALKELVKVPQEKEGFRDVYYSYQIQTDRRDELMNYLIQNEVECKIQHKLLMPDQPAYQKEVRGEYQKSRAFVSQILCLPMHEKLTDEQSDRVIECVTQFFNS